MLHTQAPLHPTLSAPPAPLRSRAAQINVWVGAFFVISGYVAGYTATELGKYEASARVKPAGEAAGAARAGALVFVRAAPQRVRVWPGGQAVGGLRRAFRAQHTHRLQRHANLRSQPAAQLPGPARPWRVNTPMHVCTP